MGENRSTNDVSFELDHLFVCAEVGAPEAERLVDLGLTQGRAVTHRGQGSANRCFLFHNAMLELIWIHDAHEARAPATQGLRLFERWQQRATGACPFGICFRPTRAMTAAAPPFPGWRYAPAYLPAPHSIHIGANSERLTEPMLFFLQSATRPDTWAEQPRAPLQHRLKLREITRLCWIRPHEDALSPELNTVRESGVLSVRAGAAHALEIGFDHEQQGKSAALMPELPVTLKW
jgi:pyruvate/2-oxoacid:ferredoxin oxidoreductase beta subunit